MWRQIGALALRKIIRMDANAGGKVKGRRQHSLLFSGERHRCVSRTQHTVRPFTPQRELPRGPPDLIDGVRLECTDTDVKKT